MSASFVVPLAAEESPSAAVEADGNPPDLQNAFRAFRKRRLVRKRGKKGGRRTEKGEEKETVFFNFFTVISCFASWFSVLA